MPENESIMALKHPSLGFTVSLHTPLSIPWNLTPAFQRETTVET